MPPAEPRPRPRVVCCLSCGDELIARRGTTRTCACGAIAVFGRAARPRVHLSVGRGTGWRLRLPDEPRAAEAAPIGFRVPPRRRRLSPVPARQAAGDSHAQG